MAVSWISGLSFMTPCLPTSFLPSLLSFQIILISFLASHMSIIFSFSLILILEIPTPFVPVNHLSCMLFAPCSFFMSISYSPCLSLSILGFLSNLGVYLTTLRLSHSRHPSLNQFIFSVYMSFRFNFSSPVIPLSLLVKIFHSFLQVYP